LNGVRRVTTEYAINQIISKHPEISEKEIHQRLKDERQRTGGLISDETLMRIIAGEFGVDLKNDKSEAPPLSIIDLVPNLSDVTVMGRVLAVFNPRTFNGRRKGKMASLLIAGSEEILRVVVWNGKTTLIETGKIKPGAVVKFSHCYTKEDRFGKVEMHADEKCEIEADLSNVKQEEYPTINCFLRKINEVSKSPNNTRVHVKGVVKDVFLGSKFERKDGTLGRVKRLILADETGTIPVVAWNERAEELEKSLQEGLRLQIVNGKARNAPSGGVEIHVDSESCVEVSSSVDEFSKIIDLTEGTNHVNVRGEIIANPVVREVTTFKGEQVKLATFELKDETGNIWVSAWREHALTASNLKAGDSVELKGMFVKKGFREAHELATRNESSMSICG